jgi:hypothetical protein
MIVMQLILLGLTWQVIWKNGLHLFPTSDLSAWYFLAGAGWLAIVGWRFKAAWPRLSPERKERARLFLPQNASEMRYWIPISFLAGITEECAYRGAAYVTLLQITGSVVLSLLVCVAAFAIAHASQGRRAVFGIGILAALFHWLVFQTNTLYLAIAIHVAYDLMVGIIAMRVSACKPSPEVAVEQTAS